MDGIGTKKIKPLPLVDCDELLEGGAYANSINKNKMTLVENLTLDRKQESKFICPYDAQSMQVRGHFGAQFFDYV